jgi:hypothetical protein
VAIDNRWVVPYNPFLTRRYRAHINVEVCSSLKVVKCLYKYIFKGTDRTTMRVDRNVDEIKTHVDGRYLSPPESAWHIYKFRSHEEYPVVQRLALHLPDEQPSTSTRTPPATSAIGWNPPARA